MCSQRLPRPGRLCRECEQELSLARSTAKTTGTVDTASDVDESLPMPGVAGWAARAPRSTVVVAAFAVGITTAVAVYALNGWPGAGSRGSVMIDRDLSSVRARAPHRSFAGASGDAAAARSVDVAPRKPARASDAPAALPIAATVSTAPVVVAEQRPPDDKRVASASASSRARVAYDRVLGLADALDGCAPESPFARLACEQRARARYCEDANGRIPQCADPPPREYGQ
jgi:hypothetical protein